MKQEGSTPDNMTFPFIAKACAKISDLKSSQIIHTQIIKSPFWSDIFVGTAVVNMYVKCSELELAHKVFEKMPLRDVTLWNSMLLGFAHLGSVDRFFVLFQEMRLQGFVPDFITIIGLTQSVIELKDVNLVRGVHGFGIRVGMLNDVSLANTLISGYSKCWDLVSAEGIFDRICSDSRTIVSWNSLIAGHALVGKYYKTFLLYRCMLCNGRHKPDISTFLSLLSSCVQHEALSHGKLVHSHVIQLGCGYDVAVSNTLLTMYSKCGDIDSAWHLFQIMTHKTCISWTAMIGGFVAKGCLDKAYSLFLDMERAGEKPDVVTLLSLLSGCGQTGSLELGRWLDNYALSNGLRDSVIVCNAIVDMYAKCGNVDKAKEVFYSMHSKTVVSWTTMISGHALNGEFIEALELFFKMVRLGLKPNHITFLAILQACTHAGFLEKGMEFFDLMTRVYKLKPGLEHCSCMVDLLGRKGKFKEALAFIESMPFHPDAAIWGALLGACKIHQNVEIGEYAACHLYRLEPQAAASYVEMANMYASAGRWDGVSEVRAQMKCNRVKKIPGQSVIQVDGKNHIFGVEERCHPAVSQIYQVLDILTFQLKKDGASYLTEDLPEHEIKLQEIWLA
ncbi:hypothetical protein SOVF_093400 [Spinacia oleracea]|nr:hypothetical protein SOVF_093400 [Spinacia oleracea]